MVMSRAKTSEAMAPELASQGSPRLRAMMVKTAIANPASTNNVPRIVFRQREKKDEAISEVGLWIAGRGLSKASLDDWSFILTAGYPHSAFRITQSSERHADCFKNFV